MFNVMLINAVKNERCLINYKPKGNPREIADRKRKQKL